MNFILSHPTESLLVAGTIYVAAVSSMSKPKREDGAYAYCYRFLQATVPMVPHKAVETPKEQPKEK